MIRGTQASRPPAAQGQWLPWVATCTALVVLGLTVVILYFDLRDNIHLQLARRDAQILAALLERQASTGSGDENSWLLALVEASASPQVPGVESLVLFDNGGSFFTSLFGTNHPVALDSARLAQVRRDHIAFDFEPITSGQPVALLRVTTALRDERDPAKILAFAEYTLDGSDLAREFQKVDRRLAGQAAATFAVAGTILTLTLGWAFRELSRANRELTVQSELLWESNRKLLLAAKTGAVGAVASNLVHGLKNPLTALQHSLAALGHANGRGPDVDDATTSMKRMRTLIDDVVRVLREDVGSVDYWVPVSDLFLTLRSRIGGLAALRSVSIHTSGPTDSSLHHRQANIALLILENLLANAIEASPTGAEVSLHVETAERPTEINFLVTDCGSGLPEPLRASLFAPTTSTKPDGSGLGLALSHQLALQLGGSLNLVRTGEKGTEFRLRLPKENSN